MLRGTAYIIYTVDEDGEREEIQRKVVALHNLYNVALEQQAFIDEVVRSHPDALRVEFGPIGAPWNL